MDAAASRRIRTLAICLEQSPHEGQVAVDAHWARLTIALLTLGLPIDWVHRAKESGLLEQIAARIRLHHGRTRELELRWWFDWAATFRAAEDEDGEARTRLGRALGDGASELGLSDAAVARCALVADPLCRTPAVVEALDALAVDAHQWLALDEGLRFGSAPQLELTYPLAYRVAVALGELRAAHLLGEPGVRRRLAVELLPALHALGVLESIPQEPSVLLELLEVLGDPEVPLSPDQVDPLWEWIGWFFEVAVGALSDAVYRAAHDRVVLGRSAFRGVAFRRALGGLQQAAAVLRSDALGAELEQLAIEVGKAESTLQAPPKRLTDRLGRWLDGVIPHEGLERVIQGRILAWAHRFSGHPVAVDGPRIERWLAQFPSEQRWVGEGLLDAVEYVPTARMVHSLGFLLRSYGLASDMGAVVFNESPAAFLRGGLRREGITLPWRAASEALEQDDWRSLLLLDDCCVSGTRLLGTVRRLVEGLNEVHRSRLKRHGLVVVVSLATTAGLERVLRYCEEQAIPLRYLVGRERRLLSDLGWREWEDGGLLDEGGALTMPAVTLYQPLFSPHLTVWGGDHIVARDLCDDIGQAILEDVALQKGWSPERRAGSGLGYSGLQGRLVLGHRVPRTTLPLLWCRGRWRGRPWVPLFECGPEPETGDTTLDANSG